MKKKLYYTIVLDILPKKHVIRYCSNEEIDFLIDIKTLIDLLKENDVIFLNKRVTVIFTCNQISLNHKETTEIEFVEIYTNGEAV
jgi:hypothetical protein